MKKQLSIWMQSGIVGGAGIVGIFLGIAIAKVIGLADGLGIGIGMTLGINVGLFILVPHFEKSLHRKTGHSQNRLHGHNKAGHPLASPLLYF